MTTIEQVAYVKEAVNSLCFQCKFTKKKSKMLESLHKQAHRLDCQLTIIQIDAESIENELNDKRKDTTNVKRDDYDKMQELRKLYMCMIEYNQEYFNVLAQLSAIKQAQSVYT